MSKVTSVQWSKFFSVLGLVGHNIGHGSVQVGRDVHINPVYVHI